MPAGAHNNVLNMRLRQGQVAGCHPVTHVVTFRGAAVASIKTGIRRSAERAGIEGVTPHVLKHTAITWAIRDGLGVEDAAEYFDTSPETIRKHYWHHSPHHQERALEIIERRLKLCE